MDRAWAGRSGNECAPGFMSCHYDALQHGYSHALYKHIFQLDCMANTGRCTQL